jgi:cyclophilin family peptidyl-prolyl cis-trans isomerase
METEEGTIVMRIDAALAPNATANFVALVGCKFYDGLTFHRLMPGFVIQGGDPAGNGSGGPGYAIEDDPVTTTYHRGTIAMARTPQPDSQGSQFFIVLDDNANQPLSEAQYPYAILGEVTAGMDVVDAIAAMPNSGGQEGRANDPVVITHATVAAATPASPTPGTSPRPSAAASAAPTNP